MLQDALSALLDREIAMHRTDMGYIHLFEQQSCTLKLAVQRGFDPGSFDYFRTVNISDNSPCMGAVRAGKSIIVEDIETHPMFKSHRAIAASAGYRAVQSTLLTSDSGNLLGVLSTHFRQPRRLLPWEMKLLSMHASHASNLIEIYQTQKVWYSSDPRLLKEVGDLVSLVNHLATVVWSQGYQVGDDPPEIADKLTLDQSAF